MSEAAEQRERLSIAVPAGTGQIGVVRGFLGTVAGHFGLGDEQTEDLKLAVSEICGRPSSAGGRITLEVVHDGPILHVEVAGLPPSDPEDEGEVRAFRRQLIDALIPEAVFSASSEARVVRFDVMIDT